MRALPDENPTVSTFNMKRGSASSGCYEFLVVKWVFDFPIHQVFDPLSEGDVRFAVGPNSLRGDPYFQADLRGQKNFIVKEHLTIAVFTDLFNVFNHVNFGNRFVSTFKLRLRKQSLLSAISAGPEPLSIASSKTT
jgi:hypothetical protein